jgi:hypothetical protein
MDLNLRDAREPAWANPLDRVYRAIESFEAEVVRECLFTDVFLLTAEAGGMLDSAAAVAAEIGSRLESVRSSGSTLRISTASRLEGVSGSREGRWSFDQIVVELVKEGATVQTVPIRVTALLARAEGEWRIAAGYWSVPFETQEEQDSAKHAGLLPPGDVLEERIGDTAGPLVERLTTALSQPRLLPELYSIGPDSVTIGSVVDEVFVGAAGQAAWEEFVKHVTAFVPRGPMRAALVTSDLGWLAANIDIGEPPTPYRFFYIWHREGRDWRIAVSHDAVSRDPCER